MKRAQRGVACVCQPAALRWRKKCSIQKLSSFTEHTRKVLGFNQEMQSPAIIGTCRNLHNSPSLCATQVWFLPYCVTISSSRLQFIKVPVGWPTAVLHWQALCAHVPTKAASWRTVVVNSFLRRGSVGPQERHQDNNTTKLQPLTIIWSNKLFLLEDGVTYAACSCARIHTMTLAGSCNKSIASWSSSVIHNEFSVMSHSAAVLVLVFNDMLLPFCCTVWQVSPGLHHPKNAF